MIAARLLLFVEDGRVFVAIVRRADRVLQTELPPGGFRVRKDVVLHRGCEPECQLRILKGGGSNGRALAGGPLRAEALDDQLADAPAARVAVELRSVLKGEVVLVVVAVERDVRLPRGRDAVRGDCAVKLSGA